MYPASIQFSNDCFHQKTYKQEYIAEDFNANTIAVTGSPRVWGEWPRYDKITFFTTNIHKSLLTRR